MAKELRIESDEAYELAHELAARRGESVTEVILDALCNLRAQSKKADLLQLSKRAGKLWPAELRNVSHDELLYDEAGLPK